MVSKKNLSLLRKKSATEMQSLSLVNISNELKTRCPLLYSVLMTAGTTGRKKVQNTIVVTQCSGCSICCFETALSRCKCSTTDDRNTNKVHRLPCKFVMKLPDNYMSLYTTCRSVANIFQVLYKLFNLQTAPLAQGQLYKMQRLCLEGFVRSGCQC